MPFMPTSPGERPTLGWYVLDWMTEFLAAPDRVEYEPFIPTQEQADFLLAFYEVDRVTGKRMIRRGVLGRPRGWGKSPFISALAIAEGLADVVGDGFDAEGQPVGRPWSSIRTPLVQVAAVSEKQTANAWRPLLEMLEGPVINEYPGLEPLATFVNLPRGRIEPITASPQSVKGNTAVFAILDQTEEWTKSNGGVQLAQTMRNNAAKIGGSLIETPNAFTPGVGSVAESSAAAYQAMKEGRTKLEQGLMYDHREAPPETDLGDRESLVAGLRYAYGDSSDHVDGCVIHDPPCAPGWSPIEGLVATIWDPDNDAQTSRADFLNQVTHASDSWLTQPEWASCADATKVIADKDVIAIGFDGSRSRLKGVTDATALIGCRISDGHLFELGVWEQPPGWPKDQAWQVPVMLVDTAVRDAFRRYSVSAFYADPAKWESYVAKWEADFGAQLKVKSTRDHPIEWWMTGGRAASTVQALEQFHSAVVQRELTHDGSSPLARHALNARRRVSRSGLQIAKEHPDSPNKIDAVVAAVLAYTARLDAIASGVGAATKPRYKAKKLY